MGNLHSIWCDHRQSGETHDDLIPYCLKQIHGVVLIPDEGEHASKLWVYATSAAHPEALTSGRRVVGDERFDGIELAIETRSDDGWTEQKFRVSSDGARSLAATLVRAADIQQGLTR